MPQTVSNGIFDSAASYRFWDKVKMIFGSKEVMGKNSMGAGFLLEGSARFLDRGEEYDRMKEKFPWLTRVLEITPTTVTQTL